MVNTWVSIKASIIVTVVCNSLFVFYMVLENNVFKRITSLFLIKQGIRVVSGFKEPKRPKENDLHLPYKFQSVTIF